MSDVMSGEFVDCLLDLSQTSFLAHLQRREVCVSSSSIPIALEIKKNAPWTIQIIRDTFLTDCRPLYPRVIFDDIVLKSFPRCAVTNFILQNMAF